jgi:hypothetical protein
VSAILPACSLSLALPLSGKSKREGRKDGGTRRRRRSMSIDLFFHHKIDREREMLYSSSSLSDP